MQFQPAAKLTAHPGRVNTSTNARTAAPASSRGRALTLLLGVFAFLVALGATAVHSSADFPQAKGTHSHPHGVTRPYEKTEEAPNADVGTRGDRV